MYNLHEFMGKEVGEVQDRLSKVEDKILQVPKIEKKIDDLTKWRKEVTSKEFPSQNPSKTSLSDETINKIKELEKQIEKLTTKESQEKFQNTAVFGGLGDEGGEEEAKKWLKGKLEDVTKDSPTDVYYKGEYKGILFATFDSKIKRDSSVKKMRDARLSRSGSRIWCSEDSPIEERACRGVLFEVKKKLVEWGYGKFEVWVDTSSMNLWIQNEWVLGI